MGMAFSADMVIIQLIIALHLMVVILLVIDVVIALDKSNTLNFNLEIDFGSCVIALFIMYILQQLIGQLQSAGSIADSGIAMDFILSTHIESISLVTAVLVMILVSIRQYIHRHHLFEKGKGGWKA